MTKEDVRIIFTNVAEIAVFSDSFTEKLEEALGGVLEGGSGEDRVGALFLETVRVCLILLTCFMLIISLNNMIYSRYPLLSLCTKCISRNTLVHSSI